MNNIFKTSSRFSALNDELIESKTIKNQPYKRENINNVYESSDRSFKPKNSFNYSVEKENIYEKEFLKKKKEKEIELALAKTNFPELNSSIICKKSTSLNFIDKFSKKQIKVPETIKPIVLPGWVYITLDCNKSVMNGLNEPIKQNNIIDTSIIDLTGLINLFENRETNYIELWGEYEYEKMFKFQNFEYGYFDRLDYDQYEEDMEREKKELETKEYIY